MDKFADLASSYRMLRVGILGDFCLDRYFEIDAMRQEISIETGLPVHNVIDVRCQPGAAGTILNNLVALGVGEIFPIGFAGVDGEGFELVRALSAKKAVNTEFFLQTPRRRTFTYSKPLLMHLDRAPEELSRIDIKNWSETPREVEEELVIRLEKAQPKLDALIILDQVDLPNTGVVTQWVLDAVKPTDKQFVLADSRRGLRGFPDVAYKMNRAELERLMGQKDDVESAALELAAATGQPVFVTLAEEGIVAASGGTTVRRAALPLRGEIDIVGAGDAVTANLACAMASGQSLEMAVELANAAASVVIHQLGTTGTASLEQIRRVIGELPGAIN